VLDNWFSRSVNSTVEIDDNLVDEASFTFFEEVIEGFFKLVEYSRVLDEL